MKELAPLILCFLICKNSQPLRLVWPKMMLLRVCFFWEPRVSSFFLHTVNVLNSYFYCAKSFRKQNFSENKGLLMKFVPFQLEQALFTAFYSLIKLLVVSLLLKHLQKDHVLSTLSYNLAQVVRRIPSSYSMSNYFSRSIQYISFSFSKYISEYWHFSLEKLKLSQISSLDFNSQPSLSWLDSQSDLLLEFGKLNHKLQIFHLVIQMNPAYYLYY